MRLIKKPWWLGFYKPACKSIKQQIPRSIKTSRTSKNSNDNFPSFGFEKMIQKIRCSPLRDNLSGLFVFFNLKLSSRLAESKKKKKKGAKLNAHKRKRSSDNLIQFIICAKSRFVSKSISRNRRGKTETRAAF